GAAGKHAQVDLLARVGVVAVVVRIHPEAGVLGAAGGNLGPANDGVVVVDGGCLAFSPGAQHAQVDHRGAIVEEGVLVAARHLRITHDFAGGIDTKRFAVGAAGEHAQVSGRGAAIQKGVLSISAHERGVREAAGRARAGAV